MIQNLKLGFFFLKIIFRVYKFYIFFHTFQWTSSEFFYFRFSSRKSQSQQKLAKKMIYFTILLSSKEPHSFYKPQLAGHRLKNLFKKKVCTGWPTKMSLFFFGNNFYKNKETFKIFSPQILKVYRSLLVKTTLESIMFYYTFSLINTMFIPCTMLL